MWKIWKIRKQSKLNSEKIWKVWKKPKLNSEQIWKMRKKSRLNFEMIWKIWKKSRLNCEMIWKIGKKSKLNSKKIWDLYIIFNQMLPTFDFISNYIASIPSTCRSVLGTILILSLKYIIIPPPYVFLSNLNGLELKLGINKLLVGTRWSKWVSVNQTISKSWTICTMSSILFLKLLILRLHILK